LGIGDWGLGPIPNPQSPIRNIKITPEDIFNYICIMIYLSIIRVPEMEMLWEKNNYFSSIIPNVMTKSKFHSISKFFHISENIDENLLKNNKIQKIEYIVNYLNQKWKENYDYSKYLTVDECMASFKGRTKYKQYIKKKRKSLGIKFFAKANSINGYIYSAIPYTGDEFEYEKNLGLGTSALIKLIQEHRNGNYHVTFDSFYLNLKTIEYCHLNNIYFTATYDQNKKCYPKIFKEKKLKKYQMECYRLDNTNVRFLIFYDNKPVTLVSNKFNSDFVYYRNKKKELKIKPEMLASYNMTKSGVDMIDSITSIHSSQRKVYKWWKAVFFYLIDISIYNASIIFYENNDINTNSRISLI
jgi:hypothetical protein